MLEPAIIEKRFSELSEEIIKKEKSNLRFSAKFLSVSEIATQYYCEKKVEMEQEYGKRETPEMKIGEEAHELLLKDSVKVKREQILKKIYSGEPTLVREMILLGKHKDIIIVGIADAIFFLARYPLFLFEFKFSNKPVPFREHHVQARLYCYLLNLMGWDTSKLRYTIVVASLKSKDDEELRKIPLEVLKQRKEDRLKVKTRSGEVNIFINNFKMEEAINELDWALGFWKKERVAIPTSNPKKCEACEYKDLCDYFKNGQQF